MPTGYTSRVGEGQTFEQFVWACARAFGAFVMMRDDAMDAPIPERFESSDWNRKRFAETKTRLAEVRAMSSDEAERAAEAEYQAALTYKTEADARDQLLTDRYGAMIQRVSEWEPPTAEHVELKKFMLEQLTESLKFDCGYSRENPTRRSGEEWVTTLVARLERDLEYHSEEQRKEDERTEARNRRVAALRESVPPCQ